MPTEPFAPERGRLMLLVVAAAVGAGVGLALLFEMLQPVLWGEALITGAMGSSPLAVVPLIAVGTPETRLPNRLWLYAAAGTIALVLLLAVVHVLVTPLDMLWYTVVDRLTHL